MNVTSLNEAANVFVKRFLILGVLLFGMGERIFVWGQNRSLGIDEANLARNICEKKWTEFFDRLDYDQYAPPLFSLISKLITQIFGNTEFALRAFPLLCGLISLILFYHAARQVISNNWILLITVWIFSLSEMQLRYSTEHKQYMCDVAMALLIVVYVLWQSRQPFRTGIAAAIGILTPWFSMPAVFILAGAGLVFIKKGLADNDHRTLLRVSTVIALWLLNFAGYYFLILQESIQTDALSSYHKSWFFPLFPATKDQLLQAFSLLKAFPYYTAGYTALALIAGGIGIIAGLIYSFRKNISIFFLLGASVIVSIGASGFEVYSLIPRMILWAFTLLLLLQGVGWQWIAEKMPAYILPVLLVIGIAIASLHKGWQVFYKPLYIEEIRPVLDSLRGSTFNDKIFYVHHEAWPAVAYYKDCHRDRTQYQFGEQLIRGSWNIRPQRQVIATKNQEHGHVWLIYSHVISRETLNSMARDLQVIGEYAHLLDSIKTEGAFAYLYEF